MSNFYSNYTLHDDRRLSKKILDRLCNKDHDGWEYTKTCMINEIKVHSLSRYPLRLYLDVVQSMLREQSTVHRTVILHTTKNNVTWFRQLRWRRATLARVNKFLWTAGVLLFARRELIVKWMTPTIRIVQQRWVPSFEAPSSLHSHTNRRFPGSVEK